MASHGLPPDEIDIDASLASTTLRTPNRSNDDIIPFPGPQPDIQCESEASTSDSSSIPQKPSLPKSRAKKARKAAHQNQQSKPPLRPAKDILSRIRHDPALDESEYIVGYRDRHVDVMEMEVSAWKGGGDFTDEEWIPQHRILYFRRKGDEDGRRIWDRAARLDRLFGSGTVPAGGEGTGLEKKHGEEKPARGEQEAQVAWRAGAGDGHTSLMPSGEAGDGTTSGCIDVPPKY